MKSVVSSLIVRHIAPVVFLAVAWRILDASPVLWTYDLLMGSVVGAPSLDNQTIWITGASSGIGAATVCELAKARARHVVLSARRVEEMARVVKDCQLELLDGVDAGSSDISPTTTFSIVPYDALAPEKTSMVVEQAIESTPEKSIDMLILNSGIYQVEPALQTSYGYRRKLFQVNVESPIELSQSLIRQDGWKERGAGHIGVVSSMMSKGPQSLSSTYGATKAAVKSYFQSLSTEEWRWLQVTNVLPGATATDMWRNVESHSSVDGGPGTSDKKIVPDAGGCMTPERVAQLLVRSISAMPFFMRPFMYEVWITKPLGLLYGYMSHYTPVIFYYTNHLVALARIKAWEEHGLDMLEMPALIRTLIEMLKKAIFRSVA